MTREMPVPIEKIAVLRATPRPVADCATSLAPP
jgi:hypothetical protein